MSIDHTELRRVMGHFATGVTVITTRDVDGKPYGLTANALCSVSLAPPLLLVCIDKGAESHPAFERSGLFAINILGLGHEDLSRRFAVSGGDKFVDVSYRSGTTGVPVLEGVLGVVECRVVAGHDAGDHTIYVGEVQHMEASRGDPLLFFRGKYRRLGDD
jgi:flavin-dependent trigonelline monooxygenase, reductase component